MDLELIYRLKMQPIAVFPVYGVTFLAAYARKYAKTVGPSKNMLTRKYFIDKHGCMGYSRTSQKDYGIVYREGWTRSRFLIP